MCEYWYQRCLMLVKFNATLECVTVQCMLATMLQRLTSISTHACIPLLLYVCYVLLLSLYHQGYYCKPVVWTEPTTLRTTDYYCQPSASQFSVSKIKRASDKQGVSEYTAGSTGLVYTVTVCPPGSSCPQGATQPIVCAAGTYSAESGAVECQTCPAGMQVHILLHHYSCS
jgi:hypothetical protein